MSNAEVKVEDEDKTTSREHDEDIQFEGDEETEEREGKRTVFLFEAPIETVSSSGEPPMEEWSSLNIVIPEENRKKLLYQQEKYDPGSGEICAAYIAMSDSAVLKHPYYNYPAIKDPGILAALQDDDFDVIYPDDGQELYLETCKIMEQCPVRIFHKGLQEREIDLSYYGVNPDGVRPMAMALKNNTNTEVLKLTDNFLNDDACFHLGELLFYNNNLVELDLSGCRIGIEGLRRLIEGLPTNHTLKSLNLNKNKLGDVGGEMLANVLAEGIDIEKLYLSYNNLGAIATNAFIKAFENYNDLRVLDLSWNKLYTQGPTAQLLTVLSENVVIEEMYLSWNALASGRIGEGIQKLMGAPQLTHLDLSHNRLADQAITNIAASLKAAENLAVLNLSDNPISPHDANLLVSKMKSKYVMLRKLYLDNIDVNEDFLVNRNKILDNPAKSLSVITYGRVIKKFSPKDTTDLRDVVLNRLEFLWKKPKKHKMDIALVAQALLKNNIEFISARDFQRDIKNNRGQLSDDLANEISNAFPGAKNAKNKIIDVKMLVEYIRRKWPDRKLPPTPPPEPEPEPEKNKKGKKGKKNRSKSRSKDRGKSKEPGKGKGRGKSQERGRSKERGKGKKK